VKKEGNSLVYTTLDGTIIKKFRKAWEANTDGCLDIMMAEFGKKEGPKLSTATEQEEVVE